jgi:hypothetical protein
MQRLEHTALCALIKYSEIKVPLFKGDLGGSTMCRIAEQTGASHFGNNITESNGISRVSALPKELMCKIGMLPSKLL